MVSNKKLSKSKEDDYDKINKSLDDDFYGDIDLSMFEDMDIDLLKVEMENIKDAINNESINLSMDERIKLKEDLNLISRIIDYKYSMGENSQDEGSDSVDVLVDEDEDISVADGFDSVDDSADVTVLEDNVSVDDSIDVLMLNDISNSVDGVSDSSVDDVADEEVFDSSVDDLVEEEGDLGSIDDLADGDISVDDLVLDEVSDSVDVLVDEDEDISVDVAIDEVPDSFDDEVDEDISVDDALNGIINDYSDEIVIKVENVSMDFAISMDKIDTLKEFFIRTIKRNKSETKLVHALKNVSFEINKGDRVGIIGFNGAGKSTLLKLLAQVYYPTEGTIETKGKIAPLLELGAGFDYNYTGKANIFLNGAFLGFPEEFLKEKYDEIVEFSELGDAINYHVKTYSSGMKAKLAFSIATIVEPDILILDEVLSVGDIKFKRKSSDKIKSLINSGITVLLVSHAVGQIRELCNKAIWIDEGELVMMGNVNDVCDAYVKASKKATSEQLENLEIN